MPDSKQNPHQKYNIPNLLKIRAEEAEVNLASDKEFTRRLALTKIVWQNLFEDAEKDQAIISFRQMINECRNPLRRFTEYLGKVYQTNGECCQIQFIKEHPEKIKALIDYILGYAPELEADIDPSLLLKAKQHSQEMVSLKLTQDFNQESSSRLN